MFHTRTLKFLASVGFAALLYGGSPAFALAATGVAPPLGLAYGYAVLGANAIPTSGTVTCTNDGPGAVINGNVGTTGASITINGPCTINGSTDLSLPLSGPGAVTDFHNAYAQVDVLNPDSACLAMPTVSGSVAPGVYCSAASTTLGAGIILTLNGSASDVWVFKIGALGSSGALTFTDFSMVMGSGAQACNVYWRTAAAATMTRSIVVGTILSGGAITETGGSLLGRALATTDVTLTDPSPLTFAACAAPATITVNKTYSDANTTPVQVALSCTTGTVTATPKPAAPGAPATFTVTGAGAGTTCQATETVPSGYTANQTNCVSVALNGSCTIVNTAIPQGAATITVYKDFIPNRATTVPVALTCSSGTVTTTSLPAAEGAPAMFTVTGASAGATCRATETVPSGYTANQMDCSIVALNGSCTITNTLASTAIPTLSGRAMIMLAALLALSGFVAIRRLAT